MTQFDVTLGPKCLGAELLARVAREHGDGELTWDAGGQAGKLRFQGGRPASVFMPQGGEVTEREAIVAALRSFAVTMRGRCSFTPAHDGHNSGSPHTGQTTGNTQIDTLGECLVAVLQDLPSVQLDTFWAAREAHRLSAQEHFPQFASALHSMGGPALQAPESGTPAARLIAGASAPEQRGWLALIALGAVEAQLPDGTAFEPGASSAAASRQRNGEAGAGANGGGAEGVEGEIQAAYEAQKDMDHYAFLGVTRESSTEDIRKQYFAMAKQWHSDRFAGQKLSEDAKSKVDALFRRVEEAFNILTDKRERQTYDWALERQAQGLPTDPKIILEAENQFQRGKAMVRRGRAAEAEAVLRKATELNPGEAEFFAYLGFAIYSAGGTSAIGEARAAIAKALQIKPDLSEGLEFKGRIDLLEGNLTSARELLGKALKANPQNRDAEREMRLLAHRIEKSEEDPGLLGKLKQMLDRR